MSIRLNKDALEFMDALTWANTMCDLGCSGEEPAHLCELGLAGHVGTVEGYQQYILTEQGRNYMQWLKENGFELKGCSAGEESLYRYNQLVDQL